MCFKIIEVSPSNQRLPSYVGNIYQPFLYVLVFKGFITVFFNAGRLAIFYGNKSTSTTLQNFTTTLCKDPQLENRVKIDLQSTLSTIEGGAQKQQLIDIECKNVFLDAPKIAITFKYIIY